MDGEFKINDTDSAGFKDGECTFIVDTNTGA